MKTTTNDQTLHPTPTPSNAGTTSADTDLTAQYSRRKIAGVWAAAALPMAALAWVVAPTLAHRLDGPAALPRALIVSLTIGLVWQFVLVLILVRPRARLGPLVGAQGRPVADRPAQPEDGSGRWAALVGLIPCLFLFAAEELVLLLPPWPVTTCRPSSTRPPAPRCCPGAGAGSRVLVALTVFNTALGEELLFRGLLLPRMRGAFGRGDWVANGALFAAYHLHVPWAIPAALSTRSRSPTVTPLPQRLDRHRGAQRPERRRHRARPLPGSRLIPTPPHAKGRCHDQDRLT